MWSIFCSFGGSTLGLAAECWPEAGLKTLKPSSPQVPEPEKAGSALFLHTEQGQTISALQEQKQHSMHVAGHNFDLHWVDAAVF